MKNIRCIFVDDGSPEASDYDNNFVCYDADSADGYKQAVLEMNRSRGMKLATCSGTEPVFRLESEPSMSGDLSGSSEVDLKQSISSVWWGRFLRGCQRLIAMARSSFQTNRRRASRRAIFPTDRFLRRSREGLTFP